MFRLVFLWLIALLTFFSQAVVATDLVVNQNNAAASDENPGTEEKPLKTISAAAAKVHAGDKVIIHGGDYREMVVLAASGTVEAPIIFAAAPGEKPVIKGSEIVKNWVSETGDVWRAQSPPLPERSPDSKDPSFWETNDVRQVFVKDDVLLDALHLRRVTTNDKLQPGTFFCDIPNSLLFVRLTDSTSPNDHQIEVAVRGAWLYVFGTRGRNPIFER